MGRASVHQRNLSYIIPFECTLERYFFSFVAKCSFDIHLWQERSSCFIIVILFLVVSRIGVLIVVSIAIYRLSKSSTIRKSYKSDALHQFAQGFADGQLSHGIYWHPG
jgi:hypothetical protein